MLPQQGHGLRRNGKLQASAVCPAPPQRVQHKLAEDMPLNAGAGEAVFVSIRNGYGQSCRWHQHRRWSDGVNGVGSAGGVIGIDAGDGADGAMEPTVSMAPMVRERSSG